MSEKISVIVYPRTGPNSFDSGFNLPWTRVYFRKSLDEICSYLEVETTPNERPRVKTHDKIQIIYTNEYLQKVIDPKRRQRPVVTCLLDDIEAEVSSKKKNLKITGRSKARDLIDSTWSDSIENPTSLLGIVKKSATRFNINVFHMPTNNDGTKLVKYFAWENESPWQKIIQEADNQGYLITSSQAGDLYVWPPATNLRPEGFSLEEGKEIISIRDKESGSEQYNAYQFVGGSSTIKPVVDPKCKTNRILTINLANKNMDDASIPRRMQTEMLRRRNRRITVGVRWWGLSPDILSKMSTLVDQEILWEVNFLTSVKIPSMGIDANMLVSQVEGRATTRSMGCDIQLASPEAYR